MTEKNLIQEQARCIAHEIRNHISICDVYTEIIRRQLANSGVENQSVNNALDCIGKSLKIISNTLTDLKSLDNINISNYDLRELLFHALEMSKVYVNDKVINFTLESADGCEVKIDENKFLACVVNIIKNAVESIGKDGWLKIETKKDKAFAYVQISNNGKPIPAEKQSEIFNNGYTTKKTGSGLGLYICKNNLKQQGAELRLLKSTEEKTIFEIKIPLA